MNVFYVTRGSRGALVNQRVESLPTWLKYKILKLSIGEKKCSVQLWSVGHQFLTSRLNMYSSLITSQMETNSTDFLERKISNCCTLPIVW